MAKVDQASITYEAEHSILCYLRDFHDGLFVCAHCREEITPATGWKPYIEVVRDGASGGLHTVITHVICGECVGQVSAEWAERANG